MAEKYGRTSTRRHIPNPVPKPRKPPQQPPPSGGTEDEVAVQWLEGAPAASAHVLEMLGRPPGPDPGPSPSPPSDFQQALQDACDRSTVLQLNAPITLDAPVAIRINDSHQGWFGLDGRMNRITSNVVGAPAIRFYMDNVVPAGVCARGMFVGNASLICQGMEEGGLQLDVAFNDRWLVNPELRSLWIEGAGGKAGLIIAGSIFEGNLYGVGAQNCLGNGAYLTNAGFNGNKGVVSAMRWFGGTLRQNGGDGILVDTYDGPYDVRLFGLYFCENAGAGINTLAGLELVDACGFENNHAGHAIYVENFAHLRRCTGSTWGPQTTLVRGYVVSRMLLEDCSLWNYGGGESVLANLEGGTVVVQNCEDGAVLLGGASYLLK